MSRAPAGPPDCPLVVGLLLRVMSYDGGKIPKVRFGRVPPGTIQTHIIPSAGIHVLVLVSLYLRAYYKEGGRTLNFSFNVSGFFFFS